MKPIVSPGTPWRNLLVLSVGIFLAGAAFNCTVNLLSTIDIESGLGTAVNGVIFAVQSLSSAIIPPFLISRFGSKMTLAFALFMYCPYVAGNLHPTFAVYLPLAALAGLGAGLIWPSALTYVANLSKQDAEKSGKSLDQRTSLYFGIFYMFFTISNVVGNLVSYLVLRPGADSTRNTTTSSITDHCGINFCDAYATEHTIIVQPSPTKVHLLTGIFMGSAAAATLVVTLFLDEIRNDGPNVSPLTTVVNTLKCLGNVDQLLLIPITIFTGLEYSFMSSDFTKAYVGCTWGVHYIGLVTMVLGVSATVASCSLGFCVRLVGRTTVVYVAAMAQASSIALLWLMDAEKDGYYLFYVVVVIWGISDTVWQAQIKAMYGILFPTHKSESYSLLCCIECFGFVVGFACSATLCTEPKLYLLSVVLVLGMAGYIAIEFRVRKKGKSSIQGNSLETVGNGVIAPEVPVQLK